MKPEIEKAKAFSEVRPEEKKDPKEKPKISAVVIVSLKSSERIMIDCYSPDEVDREISYLITAVIKDLKSNDLCIPLTNYYLNGQRHVNCVFLRVSQIECISSTKIDVYKSNDQGSYQKVD